MYGVGLYSKVRMAVLRDGVSQREAARLFGIDRGTVSKMVGHAVPPGYRQAGARFRPKLDAHAGFIDEILQTDLTAPKKQRHTILRIFERLRDERGFDGGYTTVRDYVRPRRLSLKEVFVPLVHPAGHAQADFGEAWAVLGGIRRKERRRASHTDSAASAESWDRATCGKAVRDSPRSAASMYAGWSERHPWNTSNVRRSPLLRANETVVKIALIDKFSPSVTSMPKRGNKSIWVRRATRNPLAWINALLRS